MLDTEKHENASLAERTALNIWKTQIFNIHTKLTEWEKDNLGSGVESYSSILDPLIHQLTLTSGAHEHAQAGSTEKLTVVELDAMADKKYGYIGNR